jgi:hypothetical protein
MSPGATGPLWPWMPSVVFGARLVHRWLRGPRTPGRWDRADALTAALLSSTALAHVIEIPSHWAEGPALGLFFVIASAVLLGQATSLATAPSPLAYRTVVVSTAVLIGLYVLARQVTLPVVNHRDAYSAGQLAVKAAEALALALAFAHCRRQARLSLA